MEFKCLGLREDFVDRAVEIFGLTDDYEEAGYILADGRMLDFSGKNMGGRGGTRSLDHRDICDVDTLHSGSAGMDEFMDATGSIRFGFNDGDLQLNMLHPPTLAQIRRLVRAMKYWRGGVYIDLEDGLGDYSEMHGFYIKRMQSFNFDEGVYPNRVFEAINEFYEIDEEVDV